MEGEIHTQLCLIVIKPYAWIINEELRPNPTAGALENKSISKGNMFLLDLKTDVATCCHVGKKLEFQEDKQIKHTTCMVKTYMVVLPTCSQR